MSPTVTALYTYPLKSAPPVAHTRQMVEPEGLAHDRRLALIGEDGEVLTGRDFPALLSLAIGLEGDRLTVAHDTGRLPLSVAEPARPAGLVSLTVHGAPAHGLPVGGDADAWFSDFLGIGCRLVRIDPARPREVLVEHGGRYGDRVSFADECPILLAGEASLADLNARLRTPVPMTQLRPNVVIAGAEPFAEDGWTRLRIGPVEFEVVQRCARCVLATVDPITRERHPAQEPLRTLAGYHRAPGGGAAFGVHLIARGTGEIAVGDALELS